MLKHLPVDQWPAADRVALDAAFVPGDIFDEDGGPGAHLSPAARRMIVFACRRWLGFLAAVHPELLAQAPDDRITREMVREFIEHLSGEVASSTIAITVSRLYYAARLIAPTGDWDWLGAIKSRLTARIRPVDRFDRLVAPWRVLDYGIELMDAALSLPESSHYLRELQYRDGLMLAVLSLWPIRRRSLAALTVSRHVARGGSQMHFLLHPEDTKSGRSESFLVPEILLPYVDRYLDRIRPRLLGAAQTDVFWVSYRRRALCGQQLYEIARRRTNAAFGKAMALHDFRRAPSTRTSFSRMHLMSPRPAPSPSRPTGSRCRCSPWWRAARTRWA